MQYAICLGLFLPLISFLLLTATSNVISRRVTGLISCLAIFIPFVCFSTLLYFFATTDVSSLRVTLFKWIPIEKINADFTLQLDQLSLLMTMIITGVGFLIHVYSIGYMEHDEDYARYFGFLNFFVFAMLLLVLAGNLILLFVGWEGVGLASYFLIGYYYQRPSAAQAATKAFVVNRIGDFGFLLGLLLTFQMFGTSDIAEITKRASQEYQVGAPIITVLTLLLFTGAVGKSAQLPLHVWLPDAMEGPTPVSALIHAATMVTAGVYLIVRMHEVFVLAPTTMLVIGIVGAATALFASLCALGQTDLKRVLAYSTVSQLGLMFLACGVGAFYAAMFHLTTHAFMKALLFLSAGNVVHAMQGTTEMEKMGGLSKKLKVTNWLFLIGVLAMSGIPPLAAFFSKDLILEQGYLAGYYALFYVGLFASILTAFYLTRAYCLTFTGAPHLQEKIFKLVKEAPKIMLLPVSILALLSIFGGFLGYGFGKMSILESFLKKVGVGLAVHESNGMFFSPQTWMSIFGGVLGIAAAAVIYTRYQDRLGKTLKVLHEAFYIDTIYQWVIVKSLQSIADFVDRFLEPKVFTGSLDAATQGVGLTAKLLQKVQSGQLRDYVAWMVIGAVILVMYFVFLGV